MAASNSNKLYHRESKLIISKSSDSDSSDGYDVPPEYSDSSDSDHELDQATHLAISRVTSVPVYVEDSLPRSTSSSMSSKRESRPLPPPPRKGNSDSALKCDRARNNRDKQTAMVQPVARAHAGASPSTGDVDVKNVLWYHGMLSRHAAEGLLLASGEDGTYLLRDSSSDPKGFSLSVRCNDAVKHFQVSYEDGNYYFGLVTFPNLKQFLEHFKQQPLIGGEAGTIVVLKYPYFRDVSEPDIYETATVHTVVGPMDRTDSEPHLPVAIASKSGYLTKLGGRRKNWKRRWFVLFKNELQYFKSQHDKTPIRKINLQRALEVEHYNAGPRDNCFRLVCPERTFYMYAGSKVESDDWLKLIQWKMAHNLERRSSERLKPSAS